MSKPHRPLISWVSFMFWGVVPSPKQFRMPVSLNLPWPQYHCENLVQFSLISVGFTRFYLLNEGGKQCGVHSFLPS